MLIKTGGDHQERVPIPHEIGEWFELRRLNWSQWERAEQVALEAQTRQLRNMGEDIAAIILNGRGERRTGAESALTKYDRRMVLLSGIAAWSYEDEVSAETIGTLDPTTVEWAHREILRLNGLGEPTPAATSNGSTAVTAGSMAS